MCIDLVRKDGQRKFLTTEERDTFFVKAKELNPMGKTFCLMLAHTGCLISEAINIRYKDINLSECAVTIHTLRKRNNPNKDIVRIIPLSDNFVNELAFAHKLNAQNTSSSDAKLWNWSRKKGFLKVKKVMQVASIKGLHATPMGIRHAFGLYCVEKEIPLIFIRKWMGHSSLAITEMYSLFAKQDEREMAERIWNQ